MATYLPLGSIIKTGASVNSTDSTSKLFLVGATSQSDNPQTYSNSKCYIQDGNLYAAKVYNSVWNDYAELFPCIEHIEPGHIGYMTEEGLKATGDPKTAMGVCSNRYGHLLGGEGDENDPNYAAIGLAGRVSVKIDQEPRIGDIIIAKDNGKATVYKGSYADLDPSIVIGKCCGKDTWFNEPGYAEILIR